MPTKPLISSPRRRRSCMPLRGPETLESRRMAAVLTYTDVDGDIVKLSSSKVTVAQLQAAVTFHAAGLGKEIQQINLSSTPAFQGAEISVAVTSKKGNGRADVGDFIAAGRDLAKLTVSGNLSTLSAGDANPLTPGITAVTVGSFIKRDWGQGIDLSDINGGVKSFQVLGDAVDEAIYFRGHVGQIVVKGSTKDSGFAALSIGSMTVTGDMLSTYASGLSVQTFGNLGTLTVNGSILAGRVLVPGHIGTIKVLGSIIGSWNDGSGSIIAGSGIDVLSVKGNVAGWAGDDSGSVTCYGDLGNVTIGGSLTGANGTRSGRIFASHKIGSIWVKHDVAGAGGWHSGEIVSQTNITGLRVDGGLYGGSGDYSGRIEAFLNVKNSVVYGIRGGDGYGSGVLIAYGNIIGCGIFGDVKGGIGDESGRVVAVGTMSVKKTKGNDPYTLYVQGSVIGGNGDKSGSISAESIVGTAFVGGSVVGGHGSSSGSIRASKSIGTVIIAGSLVAGLNSDTGSIRAGDSLEKLTVKGNVVGNATQPVLITAAGLVKPDAILSITVTHGISNTLILAGYNNSPIPDAVSGSARMGTVNIAGNLVASSIVAGAEVPVFLKNGAPFGQFGTIWDAAIGNNKASIIAKVIVGGNAFGTAVAGDHYGIVGGWIGTVMIGGKQVALPGPGGVTPVGGQSDVKVHVLA